MNLAYYLSKQKFTAIVLKLSTYRGRAFLHGFLCILHLEKMPIWRKYRDGSIIRSGRHLLVIVLFLGFLISKKFLPFLWRQSMTLQVQLYLGDHAFTPTRLLGSMIVGNYSVLLGKLRRNHDNVLPLTASLLCHLSANFDRDKQVILVLPKELCYPQGIPNDLETWTKQHHEH